jgi:hypothetical protein
MATSRSLRQLALLPRDTPRHSQPQQQQQPWEERKRDGREVVVTAIAWTTNKRKRKRKRGKSLGRTECAYEERSYDRRRSRIQAWCPACCNCWSTSCRT